jgi:hypothetical protein
MCWTGDGKRKVRRDGIDRHTEPQIRLGCRTQGLRHEDRWRTMFLALPNVTMSNGFMMEIFRNGLAAEQQFRPPDQLVPTRRRGRKPIGHCHAVQTDQLIGVGGTIKLALWECRERSPSKGPLTSCEWVRTDR